MVFAVDPSNVVPLLRFNPVLTVNALVVVPPPPPLYEPVLKNRPVNGSTTTVLYWVSALSITSANKFPLALILPVDVILPVLIALEVVLPSVVTSSKSGVPPEPPPPYEPVWNIFPVEVSYTNVLKLVSFDNDELKNIDLLALKSPSGIDTKPEPDTLNNSFPDISFANNTSCIKSSDTENNWPWEPWTSNTVEPELCSVKDVVEFELDIIADPVINVGPSTDKLPVIIAKPDNKELSFTSNLLNEPVLPIISPLALIFPDAVILVKFNDACPFWPILNMSVDCKAANLFPPMSNLLASMIPLALILVLACKLPVMVIFPVDLMLSSIIVVLVPACKVCKLIFPLVVPSVFKTVISPSVPVPFNPPLVSPNINDPVLPTFTVPLSLLPVRVIFPPLPSGSLISTSPSKSLAFSPVT